MSKDLRFDALLGASKPESTLINKKFTDEVMEKVKNPEILSAHIRNMDVTKKETFMTKLKHLPKLAIVAIAIGGLLILSGTAYATYQLLWAKPAVELTELKTSTSGREEALLATKACGTSDVQRFELKKGATITADRIPAVVKAQCELKAIDAWAQLEYGDYQISDPKDGKPYDQTMARVSMATKLDAKQGNTWMFGAIDTYGQPAVTYEASKNVKYIVDGKETKADAIKAGDVVAYVVSAKLRYTKQADGNYSGGGMPEQTLVAVVKLSMPFEDYDQFAWQSLAERQSCYGNPGEDCVPGGASIDLYMGGGKALTEKTIMKQIQGVVTAIDGKTVSIKGTSGKVYKVTTPTDVIKDYNEKKASRYYNNQRVGIGSSIDVSYVEAENEHATSVDAAYMRFMIELVSKGDAVKAY